MGKNEEGEKIKYKFVLSAFGKRVYKGGNKIPMIKPLNKTFSTRRKAEYYITTTLGSASRNLYLLKEVN